MRIGCISYVTLYFCILFVIDGLYCTEFACNSANYDKNSNAKFLDAGYIYTMQPILGAAAAQSILAVTCHYCLIYAKKSFFKVS